MQSEDVVRAIGDRCLDLQEQLVARASPNDGDVRERIAACETNQRLGGDACLVGDAFVDRPDQCCLIDIGREAEKRPT